jgi:hypothetical protein
LPEERAAFATRRVEFDEGMAAPGYRSPELYRAVRSSRNRSL